MIENPMPSRLEPGQFDADGFLVDPGLWNEELARLLARNDGLGELTQQHWQVIHYLREHYLSNHTIPVMRHVCWVTHQGPHCVTDLFGANVKEAWRVAGLPNPGEEAKAYM